MPAPAGFDLSPPLSSPEDQALWANFILKLQSLYKPPLIELREDYISFYAGKFARIPFDGQNFLCFSFTITNSNINTCNDDGNDNDDNSDKQKYSHELWRVAEAAEESFGKERIHRWIDAADKQRVYSWREVKESVKKYKKPGLRQIFSIQTIPNKGRGLIATVDIPIGTRILAESPLFTQTSFTLLETLEETLKAKVSHLTPLQQSQFLALHNKYTAPYPLYTGIFRTNALPCGVDSPVGAVYPTICLMNHDCLPNTTHFWNENIQQETIHATRFIPAGSELTISYATSDPRDSRRQKLQNSFNFLCTCSLCSLLPSEIFKSDTRRGKITNLDSQIGNGDRVMNNPTDCLQACHTVSELLKEEYPGCYQPLLARTYYDAFQICITHGDQARATVFAGRLYDMRILCEGEDSPETEKAQRLRENPEGHRNFGASRRWKKGKGMVPKGLDEKEFEKWLWKLA
ncbi:hypothetical protein TWF730_000011 [Orbilia blumenaviensis]|uniref:SET domain-containing protein n=1 Tax=Orbilia blumenaviensis TaxID=1796055 RepID=A0AAV9VMK4_9PEZI